MATEGRTAVGKTIAAIEAQRLAWRHTHEFLSWLAFRRDYEPDDRRARMEAFKVMPRLLQSRERMAGLLGAPLAIALEGRDRFMLSHRAKPSPSKEHRVEQFAWPLLSYQPEPVVSIEIARWEYDALERNKAPIEQLEAAREQLDWLLQNQLAAALPAVPRGLLQPASAAS